MTATQAVELILGLLVAMTVLALLAHRLRIPYPIFFVLGGLALGLMPGIPHITLAPDLVLLLFLPPILFAEGILISPRAVRVHLRPIMLLAVGLVAVTTVVVALVAHLFVDLPWTIAFILGAIVSSTDAAATLAVADRLNAPHRVVTILDGENLFNDAMALVIYRAAVVAAVTAIFPIANVIPSFAAIAIGGVAVGLGVGWLAAWIRSHVTEPSVETTILLLTPFAAWIPADLIGVSAVLSVVTAAMYTGQDQFLKLSPATRLRDATFLEVFGFLLEGLLFILVGLQLPIVLASMTTHPFERLLWYTVVISLTVIVVRLIWTFGSAVLSVVFHWTVYRHRPAIAWREVAILSWAGMRGALALALALALPTMTATGEPFPERDLIIFVTFGVILVTLLLHGLSLPLLIRWLRRSERAEAAEEAREDVIARRRMVQAALVRLDELTDPAVPEEIVRDLRTELLHQFHHLTGQVSESHKMQEDAIRRLRREMMAAERREAIRLHDQGAIGDEVLQRVEKQLDLEEAQLETEEAEEHI